MFVYGDAYITMAILFLENTAVRLVNTGHVSMDGVDELVFGDAAIGRSVGEEDGGPTDAE